MRIGPSMFHAPSPSVFMLRPHCQHRFATHFCPFRSRHPPSSVFCYPPCPGQPCSDAPYDRSPSVPSAFDRHSSPMSLTIIPDIYQSTPSSHTALPLVPPPLLIVLHQPPFPKRSRPPRHLLPSGSTAPPPPPPPAPRAPAPPHCSPPTPIPQALPPLQATTTRRIHCVTTPQYPP